MKKVRKEDIKQEVARKLGIPLVVIARPLISYPRQTSCLEEVAMFINLY